MKAEREFFSTVEFGEKQEVKKCEQKSFIRCEEGDKETKLPVILFFFNGDNRKGAKKVNRSN